MTTKVVLSLSEFCQPPESAHLRIGHPSRSAGKYLVLFFYPLDFTFVCPTEIIAYSEAAAEFAKIDCNV